jgi:hypothetical protein
MDDPKREVEERIDSSWVGPLKGGLNTVRRVMIVNVFCNGIVKI